jgi:hypothetical protein
MEKNSDRSTKIDKHLYSLVIPEEILEDFELIKIEEQEDILILTLVELSDKKPKSALSLVENGYQNAIEIQHFPIMGKQCILRLIRRRWKESSSNNGSYSNAYTYTIKGTKVTPGFGVFLKETGR